MKLDFENPLASVRSRVLPDAQTTAFSVIGETRPLARVLMCAPHHLEPVPCCSVTQESLRAGFESDTPAALEQHRRLREEFSRRGVAVELLPSVPGLSDLAFARDVAATTPWGTVALNPKLPHRAAEVDHVVASLRAISGASIARITAGHIEGGDVCVARPGLLIVGVSGERTDRAGAEEFAAPFRAQGWDVLLYAFDPHFLHLDTLFTMLDGGTALACTEVLDDTFLEELAARGIDMIPASYKEARRLGCNVVSLDGRTIFAGNGAPRVNAAMRKDGFEVIEFALDQFHACGGGVHCLTMPLVRG